MKKLEFGWFLPTAGDSTAYGLPEASVDADSEYFERVITAAENAGFTYLLIPVAEQCWEAYITGAFMAAQSSKISMLIAARPGYVNPVLLAKMIATFDQLSGGRICVNLIAGQAELEIKAEGITYEKEDRYALMEEEVSIMKALWTAQEPLHFSGKYHNISGARISPKPAQSPHPKFYLGGGSEEAWNLSAKHSDVHLFWGDTPERIAQNIQDIRGRAKAFGRQDAIGFGMRLQIICRENEADALDAAEQLICHIPEAARENLKRQTATSKANQRVQELAAEKGLWISPHLWTGLTRFRPGAGIAVVGNPEQCAATLQQFIDVGCHSFCLSGYLHDAEAERFGRLVRPILAKQNPDRMS
ncbi:MAG: LLM class flavin-dependent oxidoreductase [Gammaproteobacteria bacterium]|jgi:alkanesulfonate monooxygenase|nr:LLM class flavin-dependent oxidoreductase [Gammaproteobacteria bacterium]MBT3867011.1 LLM class flavin-dependent oxidoreductase [Gammaproteobacteria bacterium]MBT4379686.1 LLM class flavin-dependent oxidoreductase [Gammaproteobacteria bacterium]MBT4615354.1 LLM class flavin-dependent oxidoreductase [Gammaproteobacteria bacterium]MBT5199109.1 LLM class flavin-dependent oxidoreductase [Gammaproteobacteria bacterium]